MKIRVEGKELLNVEGSIAEIIVGEKDSLQVTTPAEDRKTCIYICSSNNSKLTIEGGAAIVESLFEQQVSVTLDYTFEIRRDSGALLLNEKVLDKSKLYHLSLSILPRIVRQILDNSNLKYEFVRTDKFEIFRVEKCFQEKFNQIILECLEYRCDKNADIGSFNILRQLPMRVAIEESNKLIDLDKKHAIYASVRGGYNIKVKDYTNSSLEHFSDYNSHMWD